MRESAVLVLVVIAMAAAGAAIGVCAGPAKAGNIRQQRVRLPDVCFEDELDENSDTGAMISISVPPHTKYQLIYHAADFEWLLGEVPCQDLPREIEISGVWDKAAVCGRVTQFPGGCRGAIRP